MMKVEADRLVAESSDGLPLNCTFISFGLHLSEDALPNAAGLAFLLIDLLYSCSSAASGQKSTVKVFAAAALADRSGMCVPLASSERSGESRSLWALTCAHSVQPYLLLQGSSRDAVRLVTFDWTTRSVIDVATITVSSDYKCTSISRLICSLRYFTERRYKYCSYLQWLLTALDLRSHALLSL